jgi:putative transposase
LTERQTDVVVEWLKNKEYWNLDELVNYVEQELGVIYKSKQSYYELFAGTNISWKKTQKINPKSDEELVKKKRKLTRF